MNQHASTAASITPSNPRRAPNRVLLKASLHPSLASVAPVGGEAVSSVGLVGGCVGHSLGIAVVSDAILSLQSASHATEYG